MTAWRRWSIGAGRRVQSPPQPAMSSGVEVTRRARPGQYRRLELMPAGDGPAQLLDQSLRLGWYLAAQAGDGRKRERVDVRVLPAAQQARHDAQLRLGQSPVGSQFPLEPLHADSRTREQEHPVTVEQDQLVPPGHVQHQPVQVHARDRREPLCLRRRQHRIDRPSHDVLAHAHSMTAAEIQPEPVQSATVSGVPLRYFGGRITEPVTCCLARQYSGPLIPVAGETRASA
jgi:hypothetical protein